MTGSAKQSMAARKAGLLRCARNDDMQAFGPLHPEDRQPQDQQYQEDHDEHIEQEAGDIGGRRRNPGKAKNAGDDRDQKED
jgi:hypothetical protein